MNPILRDMAVETFAQLEARNALPENANSSDVRYAADYIVKKSPFAKFFQGIGIAHGSQIKRTFDGFRTYRYLASIAQLYYILQLNPGDTDFSDLEKLFSVDGCWKGISEKIFHDYRNQITAMRYARCKSMGKNFDRHLTQPVSYKYLVPLLKCLTFDELIEQSNKLLFCDASIIAIALMLIGLDDDPKAQDWLKENREQILDEFVRDGYLRQYITLFHNLARKTPEGVQSFEEADSERIKRAFGYTHKEINAMATKFQDDIQRQLDTMERCELFEENTVADESEQDEMIAVHDNIYTTGSLTEASVPMPVVSLATRLAKKHGPVNITSEASGLHIYIPDPDLVRKDGAKELTSKHLAINAEKYLGIGRFNIEEHRTRENKMLYSKFYSKGLHPPCAVSMKTKKAWDVDKLLTMMPIEKRMPALDNIPKTVSAQDPNKYLVYDENGNLVPRWVGETVPITSLPEDHPASVYLKNRGFDLKMLEEVYDVAYCTQAEPESRATNVYYAKLPVGRKNSPACRIILPIYDENGVRHGWQARIIDAVDIHGEKWIWTDRGDWLQITRNGEDAYVDENFPKGFGVIQKYKNATGSARNTLLFGLKQAIEWNKGRPAGKKFCVLVEGPLDVCKGGPPCIALLGKSMSPEQAAKIRAHFDRVGIIADKDEAGKQCLKRVRQQMTEAYNIIELDLPPGKKDLGDCSLEEAKEIINRLDK